ncbi:unnamed protein product [Albugo candida]|uniref:EF-hand domain-containing protein n=2 Tax=Albugo candida TaxID=65357 RepID=A0A024GBW7_9STRA|nr:unnamed protein product [Albugo candida]|eukprot:CCI44259.1 unnamed protein product [Albugo candida]
MTFPQNRFKDERILLERQPENLCLHLFQCDASSKDFSSWSTGLLCLCLDAEGNAVQCLRSGASHLADRDVAQNAFGSVRSAHSRHSNDREHFYLNWTKITAEVNAISCFVACNAGEMRSSQSLHPFHLKCELSQEPEHLQRGTECISMPLFDYFYDRKDEIESNYMIICHLYRDQRQSSSWWLHLRNDTGCFSQYSIPALTRIAQADVLYAVTKLPETNMLTSVTQICEAFHRTDLQELQKHFICDDRTVQNATAIDKHNFAMIILHQFMISRPELLNLRYASDLIATLFLMFEQIDINGDKVVSWDEFSSFCISSGAFKSNDASVLTCAENDVDAVSHAFLQQDGFHAQYLQLRIQHPKASKVYKHPNCSQPRHQNYFPYRIRQIKPLVCDEELRFLHEFHCATKATSTAESRQEADAGSTNWIVDVEFIPPRNALAVANRNHSVTVWSVVNIKVGAYVFARKFELQSEILALKWCCESETLAITSHRIIQFWNMERVCADKKLRYHQDRISDIVEASIAQQLPIEHKVFASCSYDKTIAIWDQISYEMMFVLRGHVHGILQLDSHKHLLLSSGFEHQAYCWDLSSRTLVATLTGHSRQLLGARFVSLTSPSAVSAFTMAVTGDQSGQFHVWDLTAIYWKQLPESQGLLLQSFQAEFVHDTFLRALTINFVKRDSKNETDTKDKANEPNQVMSVSTMDKEIIADRFSADIIAGGMELVRFRAFSQVKRILPPQYVVFSKILNAYVGLVGVTITMWHANSGVKKQTPVIIKDTQVCALAFDTPRERKLFVATKNGFIRLYNIVTGELISTMRIHDGCISSLIRCPRTQCLISTGLDRVVCISYLHLRNEVFEILRSVDNAHESPISACAYSSTLQLIATGDKTGEIHIYQFVRLSLFSRCLDGHCDPICGLHFSTTQMQLLISLDSIGRLLLWPVDMKRASLQPLLQLLPSFEQDIMQHEPVEDLSTCKIACVCAAEDDGMLYAGTSDGQIFGWKLPVSNSFNRSMTPSKSSRSRDGNDTLPPLETYFASTFWKAHDERIESIERLPQPQTLFTTCSDCTLKIWHSTGDCLGIISTKKSEETITHPGSVNDGQTAHNSSSPWRFSHHVPALSSQLSIELAQKVIQKYEKNQKTTLGFLSRDIYCHPENPIFALSQKKAWCDDLRDQGRREDRLGNRNIKKKAVKRAVRRLSKLAVDSNIPKELGVKEDANDLITRQHGDRFNSQRTLTSSQSLPGLRSFDTANTVLGFPVMRSSKNFATEMTRRTQLLQQHKKNERFENDIRRFTTKDVDAVLVSSTAKSLIPLDGSITEEVEERAD